MAYTASLGTGCCCGGAGGGMPTDPYPGCFCNPLAASIAMVSGNHTANFNMFQDATIQYYNPVPALFAPFALGSFAWISPSSFPDPISGSPFYYLLSCQFNLFTLTRIWPDYAGSGPNRDGVLWSVSTGGGNTCSPFHMAGGTFFAGSDPGCSITLDG